MNSEKTPEAKRTEFYEGLTALLIKLVDDPSRENRLAFGKYYEKNEPIMFLYASGTVIKKLDALLDAFIAPEPKKQRALIAELVSRMRYEILGLWNTNLARSMDKPKKALPEVDTGGLPMNFKRLRERKGLTQEAVAQALDISRTTVTMWESEQSRANLAPTFYLKSQNSTTAPLMNYSRKGMKNMFWKKKKTEKLPALYRRFVVINEQSLEEFEKLCDKKHIRRLDLYLILKTIKLNPNVTERDFL